MENRISTLISLLWLSLTAMSYGGVVKASCGQCQFGMDGEGCDLAVEINGMHYFVVGAGIDDYGDAHASDGFCNAILDARITGEIRDGKYHAESFELLEGKVMTDSELIKFAEGYAEAWSSQNPEALASHYSEGGSLTVNSGTPSMGKEAIAAKAKSFMEAFPDMVVRMDSISTEGDRVLFHWTWTGRNTGPGGNGKSVRISGFESWRMSSAGLIAESLGHYDEEEYQRQMSADEE